MPRLLYTVTLVLLILIKAIAALECPNESCEKLATGCKECLCQNKFLGPIRIDRNATVCGTNMKSVFQGYDLRGNLCISDFLKQFTKANCANGAKQYIYPTSDGFDGQAKPVIVKVNTILDRFGHPNGSYLSPRGDPYSRRAAPPGNLQTRPNAAPLSYYAYVVKKDFPAYTGKVAPWFGQSGGGTQYFVPGNISLLRDAGYLQKACSQTFNSETGQWAPNEEDGDIYDEELYESVQIAH
ncbi:hypothetical protein BDW74DRAFT_175555 [Aspergillus multicolor]|uniref:TNT domain-containing protein n=1 Tax=Aspergillus multicolor TaxID=41759 RepID=UPI003CCDFD3E